MKYPLLDRAIFISISSTMMLFSSVAYAQVPSAPTITWPPVDASIQSNRPDIAWTGSAHDQYEVHVGTVNDPSSVNGWNSGIVTSTSDTAMSGALAAQTYYYVFVRLHNASGWGAWSAYNRIFYVNGQLLNDPYFVGDPSGGQWPHSIVYNPERNEYLVAFSDIPGGGGQSHISYYRLDGTGTKIGGKVTITDDTYLDGTHEGRVTYNSVNDEYLIVYSGWTNDGTPQLRDDIRGQRVNATTGALIGGSYLLYTPSPLAAISELTSEYSASSNVHLVAWHTSNGADMYALRVAGATGQAIGTFINITAAESRFCAVPVIGYYPAGGEFTVIWQVDGSALGQGWDYYGQRIRASDGALLGGVTALETNSHSDHNGDLIYDSNLNRFLLAFEGNDGTSSIWGHFFSTTLTAIGSKFPILSAPYSGGAVHADWLPSTKEYVVAFHDCCSEGDYGRRISQTGTLLGERFRINGDIIGIGNFYPTPVVNTATNDYLICWFNSYTDVYVRRYKTFPPVTFKSAVSIDLGTTDVADTMTHPASGDGDTVAANIGGRDCKRNMDPGFNDAYFYFGVGDSWAYQGSKPDVWISIEYYDNATNSSLSLQYDATGSAYQAGGSIALTGTNVWKKHTWHVTDAYFGNRENNSSDFRIYTGGGVTRYLDIVRVTSIIPGPPLPGLAGSPSPANGNTTVGKNDDLSWTAGSNATSHNIHFGTVNPPPFIGAQSGTTWDPGTMTAGTTYYWRINEYGASGTTIGTVWSFTVRTGVSIDLGVTNIQNGMTNAVGGDGDTAGANIGGRDCRKNMDPSFNDYYFYFTVDNGYAFQGNNPDQWISIEYYDNAPNTTLDLQYDATDGNAYKAGGGVALTGTNTWKKQTWHVTDAYFGNRQNNGGDFRITAGAVNRYLDIVAVSNTAPSPALPGQASNPSPANGATAVSITPTLSWTAGSGATSHNVYFGTANPPPFVVGQAGTTYAPGTLASGTTYFWRIDEANATGTTTGAVWNFTTSGLPGPASNPNPANGATSVSINADLTWTAGANATSHDVRFGTVNPPPFVINQTGTTYDPGTMSPNTTYFWRIDEKNASGTTTGTVWSFTTLPLPGAASNPSPANGATLVSIIADLTWTAGSNTVSHDVRFGTVNPPPFIQNQAGTTYDPGTMSAGTTYFWRIDEVNGSGTTTGTVWSFTTLPLPGLPSAPGPTNGATGVSISADLAWTAGINVLTQDVRFGTTNQPPFVVNQVGSSYDPGILNPTTTYYWRIDGINASGTTTGTVWSFTTATPPAAPTVTAPGNGSTVTSLTPTITWTGAAHDGYQVRVSQQNDSNTSTNGWDSGDVTNTGNSAVSGTLRNYSFYYVFVRLRNVGGWGAWSSSGYNFTVNTSNTNGTVYLGNALPTASGWQVYDTGSFENGSGITSTIVSDGGSNVWQLIDAHTSNRSKLRYTNSGSLNISFDTGASLASRVRATSIGGTPTYNLGISNGNVGGMFLRLYTTEVRLVDINGTNAGSYALDATVHHKYQLTVKNATAGNNATAAWKVYVDGTLRISWTGAGLDNGFDGFMSGHAGTAATGTWWFDNISGRADGEFTPAQWDPVY